VPAAAAEQYRLVTAERALLEQTLHGSIRALADEPRHVRPCRAYQGFLELHGGAGRDDIREVGVGGLVVGMTFIDDVRLADGALLVARGYKITAHFLERCRNFPRGAVKEPLRVGVPSAAS